MVKDIVVCRHKDRDWDEAVNSERDLGRYRKERESGRSGRRIFLAATFRFATIGGVAVDHGRVAEHTAKYFPALVN